MIKLKELLREGQIQLKDQSPSAAEDCEILLGQILSKNSAWLITHGDRLITSEQTLAFRAHLQRRSAGEPVAYIIGQRAFWEHHFEVNPSVLIPRPESEILVELVVQIVSEQAFTSESQSIADLGTGSGAIAISLAHELPQTDIIAVDVSVDALAVARRNADNIGVTNITFIESDWFSQLDEQRFSIIVTNPPYIATDDPHLARGDLRFEPIDALTAEPEGIDDIHKIVNQSKAYLQPLGHLLVEHGFEQGAAVRKLFSDAGFKDIATHRDIAGLERVSCGSIR